MSIRVLVADDQEIVRTGLCTILDAQPGIEVVAEAPDGQQAVREARRLRPDVCLLDIRMPVLDGVAATTAILAGSVRPHVLVLTTYETDADILRAVEAGATGYLLKDTPRADLVSGVRAAARGETVLAPRVATRLVSTVRAAAERPTAREAQVLGLVARGLSNAEVGRELFIAEATVKTHLIRAFTKLGVTDRTAAVTVARERGWL